MQKIISYSDKVILMATSLGSSPALYCASKYERNVAALILVSPLYSIKEVTAFNTSPTVMKVLKDKMFDDFPF
jgi:predicted alpha/beta hydrolase family esterase